MVSIDSENGMMESEENAPDGDKEDEGDGLSQGLVAEEREGEGEEIQVPRGLSRPSRVSKKEREEHGRLQCPSDHGAGIA